MLTPKQKTLLGLLIDNYGKKGSSDKTLGQLIIDAGYSESSAHNPQIVITEEMRDEIGDIVELMKDKRKRALRAMSDDKLDKAAARDQAYIADTLTKNIQLLSGGDTERQGLKIEIVNYADTLPVSTEELPS